MNLNDEISVKKLRKAGRAPRIPFMGGAGVPTNLSDADLAGWVKEEDRTPLLLCLSLYNDPEISRGPYERVLNFSSERFGIWVDRSTGIAIVGCRGTKVGHSSDLSDDQIIAGWGTNYCDISLVKEVKKQLDDFGLWANIPDMFIIFVGHSLGGTAAFCLSQKFPQSRSISFNGGAAPTNPVIQGPGPQSSRHYHIFGDLISSHMAPEAAEVIRIKKLNNDFSVLYPHSSERILASDGSYTIVTADEEDAAFLKWGTTSSSVVIGGRTAILSYIAYLKKRKVVLDNPIPGSKRGYEVYRK